MKYFQLKLFADYFQFYIQDDDQDVGDLSEVWTDDALSEMLAVTDSAIGVATVRDMDVDVHIRQLDVSPEIDESEFDRVNRTKLLCNTGRLVVAGSSDYFPDATRLEVSKGVYNLVIGYKNLHSVSSDGLEGNDSYHIWLFPA